MRSVVENFNARLSILDHSFPAICLKRYIVAAINLNRFLLDERERETERRSLPISVNFFLMTVRTISKNKKKIANYLEKILIEKSYIALSLSLCFFPINVQYFYMAKCALEIEENRENFASTLDRMKFIEIFVDPLSLIFRLLL